MRVNEKLRFLRISLLVVLILNSTILVFADPAEPESAPSDKDESSRQFYYFYPTWLDSGNVHNWGYGEEGEESMPHSLAEDQRVRVYLVWSPTSGANFTIGFTDYYTNDEYEMTYPNYNGYTDLYAPYEGVFWIRIDNTYGETGVTYDGWYIIT